MLNYTSWQPLSNEWKQIPRVPCLIPNFKHLHCLKWSHKLKPHTLQWVSLEKNQPIQYLLSTVCDCYIRVNWISYRIDSKSQSSQQHTNESNWRNQIDRLKVNGCQSSEPGVSSSDEWSRVSPVPTWRTQRVLSGVRKTDIDLDERSRRFRGGMSRQSSREKEREVRKRRRKREREC